MLSCDICARKTSKVCGACKTIAYCSSECQSKGFVKHKHECSTFVAGKTSEDLDKDTVIVFERDDKQTKLTGPYGVTYDITPIRERKTPYFKTTTRYKASLFLSKEEKELWGAMRAAIVDPKPDKLKTLLSSIDDADLYRYLDQRVYWMDRNRTLLHHASKSGTLFAFKMLLQNTANPLLEIDGVSDFLAILKGRTSLAVRIVDDDGWEVDEEKIPRIQKIMMPVKMAYIYDPGAQDELLGYMRESLDYLNLSWALFVAYVSIDAPAVFDFIFRTQAMRFAEFEEFQLLFDQGLELGMDINTKQLGVGYNGGTIAHNLAALSDLIDLKKYVNQGLDIDALDENNNTPLLSSVQRIYGDVEIEMLEYLLEKSANVEHENIYGEDVLSIAVTEGQPLDVIAAIVQAAPNLRKSGRVALEKVKKQDKKSYMFTDEYIKKAEDLMA